MKFHIQNLKRQSFEQIIGFAANTKAIGAWKDSEELEKKLFVRKIFPFGS
jgi:hypothetical protein